MRNVVKHINRMTGRIDHIVRKLFPKIILYNWIDNVIYITTERKNKAGFLLSLIIEDTSNKLIILNIYEI